MCALLLDGWCGLIHGLALDGKGEYEHSIHFLSCGHGEVETLA